MRPSNKSRSRNKNNNRRNNNTSGNVVNRVFDSAGPDGRVRGTPQQIIEKYRGLAHDALMADDRVAAESFQQHAEHYSRILQVAQRQAAERQAEQQAQQAERQAEQQARQAQQQKEQTKVENSQPDVAEEFIPDVGEQPHVVEHMVATPENKPRNRGPRRKPAKDTSNEVNQAAEDQPQPT